MSKKIITNEELQVGLTEQLKNLGQEETTDTAKTYSSLAGKIITSVRLDIHAADKRGKAYLARTKHFLGI